MGPLHGLGRSENGLQEVLVDLKWTEEERRRLVQCLAGLIYATQVARIIEKHGSVDYLSM